MNKDFDEVALACITGIADEQQMARFEEMLLTDLEASDRLIELHESVELANEVFFQLESSFDDYSVFQETFIQGSVSSEIECSMEEKVVSFTKNNITPDIDFTLPLGSEILPIRSNKKDVTSNENVWALIKTKLAELINQDSFIRWFKNAELLYPGVVGVQSDMHKIWIETNYLEELQTAFMEVAGISVDPIIMIKGKSPSVEEGELCSSASEAKSFVVGHKTQYAHAANSTLSSHDFRGYNPLFVHGRAVLEDPHLVAAFPHQHLVSQPTAKVGFLTAEDFANEFIESVRNENLDSFRKAHRHTDIMLINDIQFLAGKENFGGKIFHTLNGLLNSQTHFVITCEPWTPVIQTLKSELTSRFESSITMELQATQITPRFSSLWCKLEQKNIDLDDAPEDDHLIQIERNVRAPKGTMSSKDGYGFLSTASLPIGKEDQLSGCLMLNYDANATPLAQLLYRELKGSVFNHNVEGEKLRLRDEFSPKKIASVVTRSRTLLCRSTMMSESWQKLREILEDELWEFVRMKRDLLDLERKKNMVKQKMTEHSRDKAKGVNQRRAMACAMLLAETEMHCDHLRERVSMIIDEFVAAILPNENSSSKQKTRETKLRAILESL